jgi:GT2 family glycosyltransferase/spore maturation protein CgeB
MTGGQGSPGTRRPSEERRRAAAEIAMRTERIRILSEELRHARRELRQTQKDLELARRELDATRRRRSVRAALAVAARAKPVVVAARRIGAITRIGRRGEPHAAPRPQLKRLRATAAEDAAFRARLASDLHPSERTNGPLVSAIVVTRNGVGHLRRLLPALDRLAYRDLEVVIVDNGSSDATIPYIHSLETHYPIRVVRNAENRSFSEANNQGVAESTGEFLLLINNDVAPAGDHVLGHMVDRLIKDPGLVAVGSRLVYPRRNGPQMGPISRAADLSLQHRGIGFITRDGNPVARNIGGGDDPLSAKASEPREVEAATAACLLLRRSAFRAVRGFTIGYDYGTEDVDLCVKLRAAGGRIAYEPEATFWHHESATQHREDQEGRALRQRANRELFADLWAPRVFREVMLDRLRGGGTWAIGPLHVGITLTRDDPAAGWGDWYTAHELGDALTGLGWRVSYLERWRDHWYDPPSSVDVVISLLDAFDVRRLPDGVVTIAWVRNWTDRWLEHPWFEQYDIVLASSHVSKEMIDARTAHLARLMPLATNPARFHPPEGAPGPTVDVAFAGNHWGHERGIQTVLPTLVAQGRTVALYGKGWDTVPDVASIARGPLPYEDLPAAYADAAIVLDDTAGPTLPYGAVNSRVFDALASGTLVVTDNTTGAREVFGDLLPASDDQAGLVALTERYLADPAARRRLADELRALVLERHTYAHRAAELREILVEWASAPHVDIAVGPTSWEVAESWGDYHFGRALQRAFQRRGHPARLRLRPDWDGPASGRADVALHLFGLAERRTRPGQLSVLWVISHPELVTAEMVENHDVVFVASDSFARSLTERTGREVLPLHQATDPDRFRPMEGGTPHELLFVANSRGVRRRIVDELTPTERDLAVYGKGWAPELLDPRHLRGEHIPNHELPGYYTAATIVLNDHWPDMAENGFLSNRLYDAAACGAFVVSDRVPGIDEQFDGGIVAFGDGAELRDLIDRFLDDPVGRSEHGRRAMAAVRARHTFAHRVDEILRVVGPALAARHAGIADGTGQAAEVEVEAVVG